MTTPKFTPGQRVLVEATIDCLCPPDEALIVCKAGGDSQEKLSDIHPLPAPVWVARDARRAHEVWLLENEPECDEGRYFYDPTASCFGSISYKIFCARHGDIQVGEKRLVHLLAIPATKEAL